MLKKLLCSMLALALIVSCTPMATVLAQESDAQAQSASSAEETGSAAGESASLPPDSISAPGEDASAPPESASQPEESESTPQQEAQPGSSAPAPSAPAASSSEPPAPSEEPEAPPQAPTAPPQQGLLITGFAALPAGVASQSFAVGEVDGEDDLTLPAELTALNGAGEAFVLEGVAWACAGGFTPGEAGEYTFAAVLPAGCTLAEGVEPPAIAVELLPQEEPALATQAATTTLANVFRNYSGGTGSFTVAETAGTVTVTGAVTNAKQRLVASIPEGVTLKFQATLFADATHNDFLLAADGQGTLRISGNAILAATQGTACHTSAKTVYVEDNSQIASTQGMAIYKSGEGSVLTIQGNARVSSTQNNAIFLYQNPTVTVSGSATVSSGGAGATMPCHTISAQASNNDSAVIRVQGGTVSATHGSAIYVSSGGTSVQVEGGTVSTNIASATTHPAINIASGLQSPASITVSGGKVRAEGFGGAIVTNSKSPTITGGSIRCSHSNATALLVTTPEAIVKIGPKSGSSAPSVSTGSTGGAAIEVPGKYAQVLVEEGSVSAYSGHAILASGEAATVKITGGKVRHTVSGAPTVTTLALVELSHPQPAVNGPNVTVDGENAVLEAQNSMPAISTYGSVLVNNCDSITTSSNYTGDEMLVGTILMKGTNTSFTQNNGTVKLTNGRGMGILANAGGNTVTVKGTAQVETTHAGSGGIYCKGNISIEDTAHITGYGAGATCIGNIHMKGGTVTVTGDRAEGDGLAAGLTTAEGNITIEENALVEATGSGSIGVFTFQGAIVLNGGTVTSGSGISITAGGLFSPISVQIRKGTVSTLTGIAIEGAGGKTEVFEGATVEATGDGGMGIKMEGGLDVRGTVRATTGTAIKFTARNSSISAIRGNAVITNNATTNASPVIINHPASGLKTISPLVVKDNAQVIAEGNNGIAIQSDNRLEIRDNARVSSTTGSAIRTSGTEEYDLIINGGTVSATTGYAIDMVGETRVTLNGGLVFSHNDAVIDDDANTLINGTIKKSPFNNILFINSGGAAVALNPSAVTTPATYQCRAQDDLQVLPAGATHVGWGNHATQGAGVAAYTNGTINGFVPVPAKTVTVKKLTASDLTLAVPDKVYDGSKTATVTATVKPTSRIAPADDVKVIITATYNDAQQGRAKPVTVTAWQLAGTLAGDYELDGDLPTGLKGNILVLSSGVSVAPTSATLLVGETQQLTHTVAPANADNKTVRWSSGNSAVAQVSDTGLVTAVNPGTATITVATVDSGKTAACTITVEAPPSSSTATPEAEAPAVVERVALAQSSIRLQAGKKAKIGVVAYLSDGTTTTAGLTWKSSNTKVATVKNGKITAQKVSKNGTATITVTAENGKSAKIKVSVLKKGSAAVKATKVAIRGAKKALKVGDTLQLKAAITPGKATGAAVTWKSSNKSVLTVDQAGRVTAIAKGKAKITLSAGGKKLSVTIQVKG